MSRKQELAAISGIGLAGAANRAAGAQSLFLRMLRHLTLNYPLLPPFWGGTWLIALRTAGFQKILGVFLRGLIPLAEAIAGWLRIFNFSAPGRLLHVVKCLRIRLAVSLAPQRQPHGISRPGGRPRLSPERVAQALARLHTVLAGGPRRNPDGLLRPLHANRPTSARQATRATLPNV
jgi:hypothetical protein